jgi:hypothetical protein
MSLYFIACLNLTSYCIFVEIPTRTPDCLARADQLIEGWTARHEDWTRGPWACGRGLST